MMAARILPIFSAAFAVIYAIAVEANLAVITYHPKTGEWGWLAQPPGDGPAMYWYGWLITALTGALAVCAVALPLTRRRPPPAWIGWAVPLAVMIAFLYFLRSFFFY
jgi:hypothetical protein